MQQIADFDFETYSAAGYHYDNDRRKGKGLLDVGTPVYSEHESTEALCMAYDLKDGVGSRLWVPGMPGPKDLFDHIASGMAIEAHNSSFEFYIWNNVCVEKYGFPPLPFHQLRCSAAKCAAWSIPTSLAKSAEALGTPIQKDKDGMRLIRKFSMPQTPTKKQPLRRVRPVDDLADISNMYNYCVTDIETEADVSQRVPDLSPHELNVWLLDQHINYTGMQIDIEAVDNLTAIFEQAQEKYATQLPQLTDGAVNTAGEVAKILAWVNSRGVEMDGLTSPKVDKVLARDDVPDDVRQVLWIRSILGAASVKKLYALRKKTSKDGRIRQLFAYCGADRTGRWAGRGPQPQNLPNSGPNVTRCANGCGTQNGDKQINTPCICGGPMVATEWDINAVDQFLEMAKHKDLEYIETQFSDAVAGISGCLRGLFMAAPGKELICSDFSAIEAVVLAAMAGEEWRLEVFRTHGKIYEMSASKITGIPFQEFLDHKERTGEHHPMRKKVGKVAELASGYGGWINAWKQFGADKFMNEEEIKDNILKWRAESPMIVKFWHEVERCFKAAVAVPGSLHAYRGLTFQVQNNIMELTLLSGRKLHYHRPRLVQGERYGKPHTSIHFWGIDSLTKKWCEMSTYAGKITENIIQATARDIQANSMLNVQRGGYPIVLHVHDEIISEVPQGTGDVAEFERLMATLSDWCKDWPIRAAGGWRGKRYRKD